MKAFIAGTTVAILLAIGSAFVLDSLQLSSGNVYTTENVRR
ncbi:MULTISPECIES: hypothetical protein [Limibacillus]|uniref:Uncharacterized protein n=1 Tax=Limibacillus halophilus TaxID=1579333 RepID=A0A839STG9_9PROT|nr:hypothetical protein [Limibacillus halophilus]MBB3064676.1 hypothetical protein [Limibacillus halophilus]